MLTTKINFGVAAAAITSPGWLPSLSDISEQAATWLPILGCAWMVVQIVGYFLRKPKA